MIRGIAKPLIAVLSVVATVLFCFSEDTYYSYITNKYQFAQWSGCSQISYARPVTDQMWLSESACKGWQEQQTDSNLIGNVIVRDYRLRQSISEMRPIELSVAVCSNVVQAQEYMMFQFTEISSGEMVLKSELGDRGYMYAVPVAISNSLSQIGIRISPLICFSRNNVFVSVRGGDTQVASMLASEVDRSLLILSTNVVVRVGEML